MELALLGLAGFLLVYSATVNGPTYDERAHINCGLIFWNTGKTNLAKNAAPLPAILTLPALIAGIPTPKSYLSPIPPPEGFDLLLSARLVVVALFLFWCWTFGRIVAGLTGAAGGLCAMALALFDPTFSAHGSLATTDFLFTATGIWTASCLLAWMRAPGMATATIFGVTLGYHLLSKYSAVFWTAGLAAGALIVLCLRTGRAALGCPRLFHPKKLVSRCAQVAWALLVALVIVGAWHEFKWIGEPLGNAEIYDGPVKRIMDAVPWLSSPLPNAYLKGFHEAIRLGMFRCSYFHGMMREGRGFLLYFPALLALKPPLTLHALGFLALLVWIRRGRPLSIAAIVLGTAFTLFLAVACLSTTQIGIRHILILFPVLYLGMAWGVASVRSRWTRRVALALIGLHLATGIAATPHQLAYFNSLAGGPANAWRWFNDSNQDWGQGEPFLVKYMKKRKFTTHPVEGTTTGWIALSTNSLVGLDEASREKYRWLREGGPEIREFVLPHWHLWKLPGDYWDERKPASAPASQGME